MASYPKNEDMTEDRKRSGFSKQPRVNPSEEPTASGGKRKAKEEGNGVTNLRKKRLWPISLILKELKMSYLKVRMVKLL